MRRMPYLGTSSSGMISFICPRCRHVIPYSFYISQDECPYCDFNINRKAKRIRKYYLVYGVKLSGE